MPSRAVPDIANFDAAIEYLQRSKDIFDTGDFETALRYARKSFNLFETVNNKKWLETLESLQDKRNGKRKAEDIDEEENNTPDPKKQKRDLCSVDQVFVFRDDYYTLFDVSQDATLSAIRKAYHRMQRSFHPDKCLHPLATEATQIINSAYEVLSDKALRKTYDAKLSSSVPSGSSTSSDFDEFDESCDKDQYPETFTYEEDCSYEPPSTLLTTLHPYQKAGVKWMMEMEHDYMYAGGILADDMGLGKTIQAIALILSNPPSVVSTQRTTLIIVPAVILTQWEMELFQFIAPRHLSIFICHGSEAKNVSRNQDYDIILTTYHTLNTCKALKKINYHRIILDEAHAIRNDKTLGFRTCSSLDARYRWCLSGTPIQNSIFDLVSLLNFLRIDPGPSITVSLLKRVVDKVCLRRTKKNIKFETPPVSTVSHLIQFTDTENDIYKLSEQFVQREYKNRSSLAKSGALISRLRQCACSPHLKWEDFLDDVYRVLDDQTKYDIFTRFDIANFTSAKSRKLLNVIEQVPEGDKLLVYSNFKTHLSVVASELKKHNILFVSFTGDMNQLSRASAINSFCHNPNIKLMLVSIGCGSEGLNLQVANHIIFLDPWWNPAVEDQAIGRVHRLGQEKCVTVHRFIARNTIDERILILQNKKRHLFTTMFADGIDPGVDNDFNPSVSDLAFLLNI